MELKPFKLERYFAQYEFSVQYLLSSSDCDGLLQSDLLKLADPEARRLWDNLALGYTESLGHPLLREEIASLYQGVRASDCLVAAPEECILLAMNAILSRGDHVICTYPGYQSLYEIAQGLGCEVTRWTPDEENGWRFDPGFLEGAIQPNTRLIIANFPHNPTGYLPSRDDYLQMIDSARRHDLYFFSDEMYRLLEYDPLRRLPSACELYERAITLFGMSKTFGLAGARIGWTITKDQDLSNKMASIKDYTTICSSAPSEILSIIALRAKDQIIVEHLARIQRNFGLLDQFFVDFQDRFTWTRPNAGTIAFPRLLGETSAAGFCQEVIKKANIMLLPSTVYDYDDRHFRLGFGRENMPEALDKLTKFLKYT